MIAALFLVALLAAPPAPEPAEACFWVEGRLSVGNGTPYVRIWLKGTKRLLGVVAPSGDAEGEGLLPPSVEALRPDDDRYVWGRFHVCPLEPDRPGEMRTVTLVEAEGLRVGGR